MCWEFYRGVYMACAVRRGMRWEVFRERAQAWRMDMLHMRVLGGSGWVGVEAHRSEDGVAWVARSSFPAQVLAPRRKSSTAITCNNATSIGKEIAGLSRPMITGVRILRCAGTRCVICGEGAPDVLADCHTTKERRIPVAKGARSGGALSMKMDAITG